MLWKLRRVGNSLESLPRNTWELTARFFRLRWLNLPKVSLETRKRPPTEVDGRKRSISVGALNRSYLPLCGK